jgi:transposase-like protein
LIRKPCDILILLDYFRSKLMKKKVENIENKPIEKLFKNRFKEKLVQQFEDKEITQKEISLKYGVGKATLANWIGRYGSDANREKLEKTEKVQESIRYHKQQSQFWQDYRRTQVEVSLYKTIIKIAKSKYGLDLKKNFGL